jgi:sodium/proline symporter
MNILPQLIELILYFAALFCVIYFSYQKQRTDTDFIIGNRSLNFWLTALSAHASDMSSWLFLAYPALIFTGGLFGAWSAIGLVLFMYLNWQFVAPRIRALTEQMNNLTISAYFEARFADKSGALRYISAFMSVVFFTVYISSGLNGLGVLLESLFSLEYHIGISIGLLIIIFYVFAGGYRTVAWIDLFQGFFLLGVIVFIPVLLLIQVGGIEPVMDAVRTKQISHSLFPDWSSVTLTQIILTILSWGPGYFGQPHIITKFMGIRRVTDMHKAKYLGISWQTIALISATLIGLLGVYFFPQGLDQPERVILNLVKTTLPTLFSGLVLCAILAATTNVMAAQILVVASNLSEDFYKKVFRPLATSKELLLVSRLAVVFVSLIAFCIAFFQISTIYKLTFYAWAGLGASFGPLILLSLYTTRINKYGAFAGILAGGVTAAIWPEIELWNLSALVPGFAANVLAAFTVSAFTQRRTPIPIES